MSATVADRTHVVAVIFFVIGLVWIVSAKAFGRQFDAFTGQSPEKIS